MTDIVNPIDPPVVPPVPQRNDEATFEDRSDAGWEFAFETLPSYMQDTMDNVHQNAVATNERALVADQRATDAETAKGLAEDAQDKAQDWAEGVEPEPGAKSARQWSDKAQGWAGESEDAKNSAWAAAAAAQTSAGLPEPLIPGYFLRAKPGGGVGWESVPDLLTPVNVMPADEATGVVEIYFVGSEFYSLYGKAQKSRQARISLSPVFATTLWDSGEVMGASVTVSGPKLTGLIPFSTTAYWQIRYRDIDGVWSEWSAVTSFTTRAKYFPDTVGEPWGGGFYAGRIKDGADTYCLITAPKSAEASLTWKPSNDSTPGTSSTSDGLSNSNAMNNSAHPAAKHCRDYRGGGFNDWYLFAKSEREIEYRAFKPDATANTTSSGTNPDSVPTRGAYTAGVPPQTSLAAFKTGGAEAFTAGNYWTSTEFSAAEAWTQYFSNGSQNNGLKSNSFVVRPGRRLKI